MEFIFLRRPFFFLASFYGFILTAFSVNPFITLLVISLCYFVVLVVFIDFSKGKQIFSNKQLKNSSFISKYAKTFINLQPMNALQSKKKNVFMCSFRDDNADDLLSNLFLYLERNNSKNSIYTIDLDESLFKNEENFYNFINFVTHDQLKTDQVVFNISQETVESFFEKISLLSKIGLNFNIQNIRMLDFNNFLSQKESFPIFSMEFLSEQLQALDEDPLFNTVFHNLRNCSRYFIISLDGGEKNPNLPSSIDFSYNKNEQKRQTVGVENGTVYHASKSVGRIE